MIILISRDVIVVTGWQLIYFIKNTQKVEVSVLGKIAIALQFTLICFILLHINFGVFSGLKWPLIWATAVMSIASGLQYIYRGLKTAGAH